MTRHERAAQVWSLLVYAARVQEILSYTAIEKMTGIPRRALGGILRPIQRYCEHRKIPLLNVIAVSQKDGLPGDGFHGNRKDPASIFQEQAKVFLHNWDNPPSPKDLEKSDH
ncbi:MAG TPA: hypothetical protein VJW20_07520 [Candidatus Angelobacter sp.]|nr:hypothetical protein [Candidatus Angelobacter sp.]